MIKLITFILIGSALAIYGSQFSFLSKDFAPANSATGPIISEYSPSKETIATPTPTSPATGEERQSAAEENEPRGFDMDALNIPKTEVSLFEFGGEEPSWYIVNDSVMGGISSSSVAIDEEEQQLTFSGNLSLENNGGFASTRSQAEFYDLSAFDGIKIRVRGDGNSYRFRIRSEATGPEIAYTAVFSTEPDTWQDIYIYFADMIPLYRGFIVREAGSLDASTIRSFGLMLADKQQGAFSLEVNWIKAFSLQQLGATDTTHIPL